MTYNNMTYIKRKAVFFDRDGVVNFRLVGDYVKNKKEFIFLDDFLLFFKDIKEKNYLAFLVTNQQGVGKKLMTEKELKTLHKYMQKQLAIRTGFAFDDIFYCTSLAAQNDPRRKPAPGMILEALAKWDIDEENSWMIGDSVNDIIAGKSAGLKTVLLAPNLCNPEVSPNLIAPNLFNIKIGINETDSILY